MNVEDKMLDFIKRRHAEGGLSVTEEEVFTAVIPPDHPEFRHRPAYKYGLERLRRRLLINAVDDSAGAMHYFIGNYASEELLRSLKIS
jgi:hypothetical protein